MIAEEQKRTREAWNHIAEDYDRFVTPKHLSLGREALGRAGLTKDMSFLDVACGTGALSVPAARLGAQVTSIDLSPAMVERVIDRAGKDGLSKLQAYIMDGCSLDFEDNTFDMAGSQYGGMLFPNLRGGLREMVRVTTPGGKVVLVAFGPPKEVEFISFMMSAIKAVVPGFTGLPMDPPPLPFQVADPGKLQKEMTEAGLKEVHVETVVEQMEFESGRELWDWLMNSNPIPGTLVPDLSGEQKVEVRQVLDRMVRERSGDSGRAVLTNPVHIGIGIK